MRAIFCERSHTRPGSARGFTLIELIVVIIILGILAATALPRFANLQTQARVAKLNAALGAVKGASALAHAACLASTPQCTGTLPMEGVNVTMINTYPTANAAGIVTAAGLNVGPSSTDGYDVAGGGPAAGDVLTVMVLGNNPATCSFTYTAPGVGQAPVFSALTTTGC
jgi:MSHA pilin protein MshA